MKKEQAIENIINLSNLYGVSGFEDDVVNYVRKEWNTLGETDTDGIKNLYLNASTKDTSKLRVQLDAHSDEVGFIVQAIKPNGLLQFLTLGGWVPSNIAAQKVKVKNTKGEYIQGIVTSKPPHFMSEEERAKGLSIASLSIDIGAKSKEDAEKRFSVRMGCPVIPDVVCECNQETNLFLGKGFDCRIGVACMMDVLDEVKEEKLPFELVSTLTAQEEVGLRGAEVAAKKVAADLAIVFEGCPADDTSSEDYMIQSALGEGPMLRYFDVSMITNPEFQNHVIDLAEKHNIPLQVSVRSGGGTNGASFNRYNGAPAIVVGIPVRYAHTHHCYVDYHDYEAAKKLIVTLLRELDEEMLMKLVKPLG
ncbi:M42 family metallopeptidase [Vagococcus hydrophili]|uniref:M42 family metallopeptidase n=1 Tax=Vagococcus hydrophili TaxID=2714947 RepID=A0A6G8AWZ8_9ENTE|nr:M20/M25/M40 family metallo-hydrolase [Vagococcus hydrophili]QIL49516.1 M42 family metallopeptidase [Vagococcus hydrophili]